MTESKRMEKTGDPETHIRNIIESWDPIDPAQIPMIPLYIDQLTTFMEDYLHPYKRNMDDKIMTKTMINNYTKGKVLPPPEKKKYSRTQLMRLILIYHLKQILSITDIGSLFSDLNDTVIEELYQGFVSLQKEMKETLPDRLSAIFEKTKTSKDSLLFPLTLILEASAYKMIAEEFIDLKERKRQENSNK